MIALSHKDRLLAKLTDRTAVSSVIGLGYVGLPLAMEFCEAGYTVVGFDVSERVVALLSRGESHIQDVPAAQVAKHVQSGRFRATTDETSLSTADAISTRDAAPSPGAVTFNATSWTRCPPVDQSPSHRKFLPSIVPFPLTSVWPGKCHPK